MRKSSIANHPLANQVTFEMASDKYVTDEKTLRALLHIDRYAKASVAKVLERGQAAGAIKIVEKKVA